MNARVNWWAVLVAALVYFALGAVWYTLLAEPWMAGVGKTRDELMAQNGGSAMPYIVSLLCNLLLASVLGQVIVATGRATAKHGVRVAFIAWAGFIATTIMMHYQFEARPFTLWTINAGYPLVGMLIMGAILGAWTRKGVDATSAAKA